MHLRFTAGSKTSVFFVCDMIFCDERCPQMMAVVITHISSLLLFLVGAWKNVYQSNYCCSAAGGRLMLRERVSVFGAVKYTQLIRSVAGISCGGSVTNIKIMRFSPLPLSLTLPQLCWAWWSKVRFFEKLYSQGNYYQRIKYWRCENSATV